MTETGDTDNQWSEEASQTFIDMAEIFVPARAEQMTALLYLIPARVDEVFTVVELAAGEGRLAQVVLERFPLCRYVALDGSEAMRTSMARTLAAFRDRLVIQDFEWTQQQWRADLPQPLRCVLSSLSVHHLTHEGKQQFFRAMAPIIEPGGALLLADIINPGSQRIADLYARQYDEIVRAQSLALCGDLSGYERFQQTHWNYFAYDYASPGPDPIDHPSLLSDQLLWLREAGFSSVDCFWLRAGHAVFGGYK